MVGKLEIAKYDRANAGLKSMRNRKTTVGPRKRRTFKLTYTKQQYKDAVRSAYRLGLQDGQQMRQETVSAMRAANRHLMDEVSRLDQNVPLDSVTIPVHLAESIQRYLKQLPAAIYCAKLLRGRMKTVGGDIHELVARCEDSNL